MDSETQLLLKFSLLDGGAKAKLISPEPKYARKNAGAKLKFVAPGSSASSLPHTGSTSPAPDELSDEEEEGDDAMQYRPAARLTRRQQSKIQAEADGTYRTAGFQKKQAVELSKEEQERRAAMNERRKLQQARRLTEEAEQIYRKLLNPQSTKKAAKKVVRLNTLEGGIRTTYTPAGVRVSLPLGYVDKLVRIPKRAGGRKSVPHR